MLFRSEMIDKISNGKINKFVSENTLLNQKWIMDPEKNVKEIIKALNPALKIVDFERFKVGEGID